MSDSDDWANCLNRAKEKEARMKWTLFPGVATDQLTVPDWEDIIRRHAFVTVPDHLAETLARAGKGRDYLFETTMEGVKVCKELNQIDHLLWLRENIESEVCPSGEPAKECAAPSKASRSKNVEVVRSKEPVKKAASDDKTTYHFAPNVATPELSDDQWAQVIFRFVSVTMPNNTAFARALYGDSKRTTFARTIATAQRQLKAAGELHVLEKFREALDVGDDLVNDVVDVVRSEKPVGKAASDEKTTCHFAPDVATSELSDDQWVEMVCRSVTRRPNDTTTSSEDVASALLALWLLKTSGQLDSLEEILKVFDVPDDSVPKDVVLVSSKEELLQWIAKHCALNLARIPRVKFGAKEGKCLVVIHTDIGKCIRVECHPHGAGYLIELTDNRSGTEKKARAYGRAADILTIPICFLHQISGIDSAIIEVLEWELESEEVMNRVMKVSQGVTLRVEYMCTLGEFRGKCIESVCHLYNSTVFKGFEFVIIRIHDSLSFIPQKMASIWRPEAQFNQMNVSLEPIVRDDLHSLRQFPDTCAVTISGVNSTVLEENYEKMSAIREAARINDLVTCQRTVVKQGARTFVLLFKKSPCGYWMTSMDASEEAKLADELDKVTCGLGFFCKKCTTSFDYDFYHNLPLRLVQEPEWASVYLNDDCFKENADELRENMGNFLKSGQTIGDVACALGELLEYIRGLLQLGASVPRVRIGAQPGKALLMIHTDVGKFLRMVFVDRDGKTLVQILHDTWNPAEMVEKETNYSGSLQLAGTIFKALFSSTGIAIGVIEYEVDTDDVAVPLAKILDSANVKPKQFTLTGRADQFPLCFDQYESIGIRLQSSTDDDKTTCIQQAYRLTNVDAKMLSYTLFNMEPMKDELNFAVIATILEAEDRQCTISALNTTAFKKPFDHWSLRKDVIEVNEKVTCQRLEYEGSEKTYVFRICKGPCGYWMDTMLAEKEQRFVEATKDRTCGMGIFCKTCMDPFEFDYYQSLPLRLVREQGWNSLFLKSENYDAEAAAQGELMLKLLKSGEPLGYEANGSVTPMENDEFIYHMFGVGKHQKHFSNRNIDDPKWAKNKDLPAFLKTELLKWVRKSFKLRERGSTDKVLVPRVRLTAREHRTLLVIYTDVGKFLRLEFWPHKGDTIVYRYLDGFRNAEKKRVASSDHLEIAVSLMRSLLILEHVQIDAFEFETSSEHEHKEHELRLATRVVEILDGARLSVLKFLFNFNGKFDVPLFTKKIECCSRGCVKSFEMFSFIPDVDNVVPFCVTDQFLGESNAKITTVNMGEAQGQRARERMMDEAPNWGTVRYGDPFYLQKEFDELSATSRRVNEDVFCKRVVKRNSKNEPYVLRYYMSSCGYWIDRMLVREEEATLKLIEQRAGCGLGFFCQKCSSPFEHAYYRDFPQRVLNEMQWIGMFQTNWSTSNKSHIEFLTRTMNERFVRMRADGEPFAYPNQKPQAVVTPSEVATTVPTVAATSFDNPPCDEHKMVKEEEVKEEEEEEEEEEECFEDSIQRHFVESLARMEDQKRFLHSLRKYLLVFFQLFLLSLVFTSFSHPILNTLFAVLTSFALICVWFGWI